MQFKEWSEAWEQQQLVIRLRANNYKFTMIANDTWTSSFRQKAKNKALWMNPWMSDLIIILKNNNVLFLELKKAPWKRGGNNWSQTSKYQLEWKKSINKCAWSQYEICQWFLRAKEIILQLEQ